MNRFRLPYHLLVEEGIFSRVNEVMSDCVPGIDNKRVVIVTDKNLQALFPETLQDLSQDFHNSEIYLVEDGSFDQAVDLAKYICMHDITVVIGLAVVWYWIWRNMRHLSAKQSSCVCQPP